MFGYCTQAVLLNLQMIIFWLCAGLPGVRGIKYYSTPDKNQAIAFDVNPCYQINEKVAALFLLLFLAMIVFTILMMWPIYDKYSWDQYQLIGLDRSLQKSFRYIQMTKAAFVNFFFMALFQLLVAVYFEKDTVRIIIILFLAVYLLIEIRLGYVGVRIPHSAHRREEVAPQDFPGHRLALLSGLPSAYNTARQQGHRFVQRWPSG